MHTARKERSRWSKKTWRERVRSLRCLDTWGASAHGAPRARKPVATVVDKRKPGSKRMLFLLRALAHLAVCVQMCVQHMGDSISDIFQNTHSADFTLRNWGWGTRNCDIDQTCMIRLWLLRMLQSCGLTPGSLSALGHRTWLSAWELIGQPKEEPTSVPPVQDIVPALTALLPMCQYLVALHLPGWQHLMVFQTVQHLLCEDHIILQRLYERRDDSASRVSTHTKLLQTFMEDHGLQKPRRKQRGTRRSPEYTLPEGCSNSTAERLLDTFEFLLIVFVRERFDQHCDATRPGARRLLKDPEAMQTRDCQWSFQLDAGNLETWELVQRRMVPHRTRRPGWARSVDRSWGWHRGYRQTNLLGYRSLALGSDESRGQFFNYSMRKTIQKRTRIRIPIGRR